MIRCDLIALFSDEFFDHHIHLALSAKFYHGTGGKTNGIDAGL
jgi:hypothetical protein